MRSHIHKAILNGCTLTVKADRKLFVATLKAGECVIRGCPGYTVNDAIDKLEMVLHHRANPKLSNNR